MTNLTIAKAQNEALVADDSYDNIIEVVKDAKSKRFWELEMLTDCEFNWRAAAQEELDRRAAAIIFSELDNDDLMSIAIGEIDINDLYRKS
tara:strand:- start:24139 stop:24411 length:273 start_codon:yes stop_codon:yes gene_type:complete